jgi:hypothetical protein
MRRIFSLFSICLITSILLFSCKKDKMLTDSSAKLQFSKSTIFFDTVFTTIGSTTRHFTVHNTYGQPITISHIRLAGGASSPFKINVDGVPTVSSGEVQIAAKDSMYVFVKVTINPNNALSPVVVMDSILFDFNGKTQKVILQAIGQDVYLHKPTSYILLADGSSVPYSIAKCNDIWTNDKPHLIFNYLVVDSGCKLTMNPGTKVYLHSGGVLWVYKDATLIVGQGGDPTHTVNFSGDRLESEYADIPGQWGNIWLSALSHHNEINWAVIKNGSIGILADTIEPKFPGVPTLRMTNTIIKNMSVAGIYGQGASIIADNVLVSNCAQYSAALTIGGSSSFRQCTFGDYYNQANRNTPQILINNWYTDISGNKQVRNLDSAHFYNCIVYGSLDEELKMDSTIAGGVHFKYLFDHCLLKSGNTNAVQSRFRGNRFNMDPLFGDTGDNILTIAGPPNGGAAGFGSPLNPPILSDLAGKPVNQSAIDVGALQH